MWGGPPGPRPTPSSASAPLLKYVPNLRDKSLDLRWLRARLIGHALRHNQIGAHKPQHLTRVEWQPDNPGIAARAKHLREHVLLEGNPSAWRFVTNQEMPFRPPRQQLRPVICLSLLRRYNLSVRRHEVPGRQFWNRPRLRISLWIVPGHDIQAPG